MGNDQGTPDTHEAQDTRETQGTQGTLARIFTSLGSQRWPAPAPHLALIETELATDEPMDTMVTVIGRMGGMDAPDFSAVDWDAALAPYTDLEFPAYYRMPFHSVPGGWLSEAAATGDRAAMEAIYADAHVDRSLGIRRELAALVPEDATTIVDFGSGSGDGPAAVARRLPNAEVLGLEASPFMLTAAQVQNADCANLRFEQGFVESSGLEADSVDAVTITLVLHECPDEVKAKILTEAHRILRPGGVVVLTDTPNDDLDKNRGFYEPYRLQWRTFDPDDALTTAGFTGVEHHHVAPPLWSRTARKG
ncbi:MAG: class I SAM-dependent methyltransferase [Actinomycetota bacterium]